MYLRLVRDSSLEKHEKYLHLFIWPLTTFVSLVPFFGTSFAEYGDAGAMYILIFVV